ncbi:MAG: radical SAM protein [Alphaproteobacteria bacterium]
MFYEPQSAGVELVRGCNFSCPMCPVTSFEAREPQRFQFIDLDLLRRFTAELDRHPSIKTVWFFHFGEPLAHPRYEECLSILHGSQVARKANVVQHTNGSLLQGHKAEAILDIPIIKSLVISFDGFGDKVSFERLRGPHFDRVVENVRVFAARARETRPDLRLSTCSIVPRSAEVPGLAPVNWEEAIAGLERLFEGTGVRVLARRMHGYNDGDVLAIKGESSQEVKGGCLFLERYELYVTVNGWVQPCCAVYDERFNVGNIRKYGFAALLNNAQMSDIRHQLRLDQRGAISHCRNCKLSVGGESDQAWLGAFWQDKIMRGEVTDADELEHLSEITA